MRRSPSVGLMLGYCLRRCPNIKPILGKGPVFAWNVNDVTDCGPLTYRITHFIFQCTYCPGALGKAACLESGRSRIRTQLWPSSFKGAKCFFSSHS